MQTHPRRSIVDDSLFMRAAIAKTLGAPARSRSSARRRTATRRVAQGRAAHSPTSCTMDFNMPGMNGAETVRAIMQQRPTPVVMFSAHTKQGAQGDVRGARRRRRRLRDQAGRRGLGRSRQDRRRADPQADRRRAGAAARRSAARAPRRPSARRRRARRHHAAASAPLAGGLPRLCVIGDLDRRPGRALRADPRAARATCGSPSSSCSTCRRASPRALAERLDAVSRVGVREAQRRRPADRPAPC